MSSINRLLWLKLQCVMDVNNDTSCYMAVLQDISSVRPRSQSRPLLCTVANYVNMQEPFCAEFHSGWNV